MEQKEILENIQNKINELTSEKVILNLIHYNTNDELNELLNNMTEEHSILIMKQSLLIAHKRGAFSLEESEIISRCLRILNK
jgi:hypothetical protein